MQPEDTVLKRCSKCRQEKPATSDFFHRTRGNKSGLVAACKDCLNAKGREKYTETGAAVRRERYLQDISTPEGRERILNQQRIADRKRRRLDPEKARAERRRKYYANHERSLLWSRQHHKVSYARNSVPARARAARYRARRVAAEGTYSTKDIDAAFKRQAGLCLYCGEPVGNQTGRKPWHADHFIPLARGGTNNPENIVIACQTCNFSKHDKMPWEFMPDKFQAPE